MAKAKKFTEEEIKNISKELDQRTPTKKHSKKKAIEMLAPLLHKKIDLGYSLKELTDILSELGIPITETTLKNYLPTPDHRKRKGKKTIKKEGKDTKNFDLQDTKDI